MNSMPLPEINKEIEKELQRQRDEVEKSFYYLDREQLSQKPHAEAWNAVECIEHLNNKLYLYLKIAESNIKKNSDKKFKNPKFHMGLLARFIIQQIEPNKGFKLFKKLKAPKSAQPISVLEKVRLNEQKVFQDFNEAIKLYSELNKKSLELNFNKITVGTILGSWARISINEMMLYMLAHNRRHILQAQKASAIL